MKNRRTVILIILLVIFTILCVVNLCLGLWTVMFKGFVDFPCFVEYDKTNQCIANGSYLPEPTIQERIQVFLNVYYLGMGGAGCDYMYTVSDTMQVETPAGNFSFERENDRLLVNGEELAAGETYRHVSYLDPNPWVEYSIEFTNHGIVNYCESDIPARMVVTGSYRNRVSALKVVPITLILLAAVITLTVLLVRALRGRKGPKQTVNQAEL